MSAPDWRDRDLSFEMRAAIVRALDAGLIACPAEAGHPRVTSPALRTGATGRVILFREDATPEHIDAEIAAHKAGEPWVPNEVIGMPYFAATSDDDGRESAGRV